MKRDAYKDAGVDIEAGDEVVDRIGPHVKRTRRPGVLGGLGGFGGFFEVPAGYRQPVLVSGTDGVGTKLLLAQKLGKHNTIGIDLVAMCVNDVAVCGAEPLYFLDYFATGKLNPEETEAVIAGICEGCVQAGCALIGGETAEMPGMYGPGHYDLAGFCVGIVEKDRIINGDRVQVGDILVGLPSSGVHSNGFSLVRKLVEGLDLGTDPGDLGETLGNALLAPTRIYVRELLDLHRGGDLRGAVHITGGGFYGNIPRMLPEGMGAEVVRGSWPIPPLFGFLAKRGGLSEEELFWTFNNGIGMVLILPAGEARGVAERLQGFVIGRVVRDVDHGVRLVDA